MREVEILKKKQLKCYLYTRVSTSMQVDGYSLDAQRDKLRKYAAYEILIGLVGSEMCIRDRNMDELAKIFPIQSCAFPQLYNSVFTIHPSFLHKSKKIHVA